MFLHTAQLRSHRPLRAFRFTPKSKKRECVTEILNGYFRERDRGFLDGYHWMLMAGVFL